MQLRYIIAVLLLGLGIAVHEFGHAIAMHKANVKIEEIGFGIGPTLYSTSAIFDGDSITVTISPIPFGAFVKMEQKRQELYKAVSTFDAFVINGIGIWLNAVFGLLLLLAAQTRDSVFRFLKNKYTIIIMAVIALGSLDLLTRIGFFWGFIMLGASGLAFFLFARDIIKGKKEFSGPIAIFKLLKEVKTIRSTVVFAGALSIGVGMVNLLPFMPFDGGQNVVLLLKNFPSAGETYARISMLAMIYFLGIVMWRDFQSVSKKRSK